MQTWQRLPNSTSAHPPPSPAAANNQGQPFSDFGPSMRAQQEPRNQHQSWSSRSMQPNGVNEEQYRPNGPSHRQQWPATADSSGASSPSGQYPPTLNAGPASSASSGNFGTSNQQTPSMAQDGFNGPKSRSMQPFPAQSVREQDFARRSSPSAQQTREQRESQHIAEQQGAPHRRTQSMRPLSAFQPLEDPSLMHPGSPTGQRPPSPAGSTSRSIRTAAAPLTFKSPELRSALGLQEAQNRKIYMEGYLSKREHLGPDGKSLHVNDQKKRWQLCFVQLLGTVLSVWGVQQMEEAARKGTEVPPAYINVTDSFVDFVGTITESPQEVPGSRGKYENVFAVNTAGQNRILFGVEGQVGRRLVQAWVNAIRLATWEKVRLEEIYTGSLVRARLGAVSAQQATSGPGGAPGDVEMTIKSPLSKNGRMEGWVKARFMGTTEWRKCWLVLSDSGAEAGAAAVNDKRSETGSIRNSRTSFWSKLKAGDRSSILGSPSLPSLADSGLAQVEPPPGYNGAPGLASFFETKKARKPFATVAYAAHAFAVYPSRPELVEGSSLFKIEGTFPLTNVLSATNRKRHSGWVMIMPELDVASNKGANAEMMKWCIAFMDAFRLYGRPLQFQWDARNPLSPFFAYPIGPYKDRLFLDRELAEFLDIREERHLANRANLHGIMAARMRGERTPILPPLPQPNTESTRQLNAAKGVVQTGAMQSSQQPEPQEKAQQDTLASEASASTYANGSRLPPLDTGVAKDNSVDRDAFQGTQLSSIGERSREGSMFTSVAPTPITPNAASALDVGSAQGTASQLPSTTDSSATNSVAPSVNGATNTNARAQTDQEALPSNATPPVQAATKSSSTASDAPVFSAPQIMPAAPAIASQQLGDQRATIARKESDGLEAYDEGALYFINSMGDSLPTVTPKNPLRPQSVSSASGTSHIKATPSANVGPASTDVAASSGQSGYKSKSSIDNNYRAMDNNPSRRELAGNSASGDQRLSVYGTVDNFDQDALAASSYLDTQTSPQMAGTNGFGATPQLRKSPQQVQADLRSSSKTAAPTAAQSASNNTIGVAAPTSYPSTFGGNKKAQERKLAAQAQAQAQQDALGKPGRPGGAKGKNMGSGPKHAWAADDDEDEDDDDDENEDNASAKGSTGLPAAYAPGQLRGPNAQQNSPRLQGSTQSMSQSSSQPPQQYHHQQQQPQPQYGQQLYGQYANRSPSYPAVAGSSAYLGAANAASARGSSPAGSHDSAPRPNTFVQLNKEEQPGQITTVFQPHGLLQAGDQDKVERSAKQQEADARAMGSHLVSVEGRPPEPQAGLLGAISAHERDRKKEGGFGATLTERERERVAAERRQRDEDALRMQQQRNMMGVPASGPPGWGQQGMPAFNPMMWQQMQMMSMMNPMMFGQGGSPGAAGSQMGHGAPSGGQAPGSPDMSAQMRAAQAAQQAYMQAMQQAGAGVQNTPADAGNMSPPMGSMPMGMMPFNPYMSMYGAPMGFPAWGPPPGSDMGMMGGMSPQMTATAASPVLGGGGGSGASVGASPQRASRNTRGQTSSPLRR